MNASTNSKNTVLITGATYGIGYELARVFAESGSDLILVARTQAKLDELKLEFSRQYPIRCEVIAADLTLPADLDHICQSLADRRIDVLVNNAGFGDWGFFHERDWQKNSDMIDLNVKALTKLTHFFLPAMVRVQWKLQ